MNKTERLEKIRRFVTEYEIGTQEEIVEHLKESGISATQATVSRDIKELGIVKIPLKDNTYVYELPKSAATSLTLSENNVQSYDILGNMINLDLIPGSTLFVKNQILGRFADYIFSILADDDTILLILKDEREAQGLMDIIKNW